MLLYATISRYQAGVTRPEDVSRFLTRRVGACRKLGISTLEEIVNPKAQEAVKSWCAENGVELTVRKIVQVGQKKESRDVKAGGDVELRRIAADLSVSLPALSSALGYTPYCLSNAVRQKSVTHHMVCDAKRIKSREQLAGMYLANTGKELNTARSVAVASMNTPTARRRVRAMLLVTAALELMTEKQLAYRCMPPKTRPAHIRRILAGTAGASQNTLDNIESEIMRQMTPKKGEHGNA